ncbi:hypothetical protein PGB90_004388 [Kerria lacca]
MSSVRKFIDIGANLTDTMYQGIYNGIRKHEPDLNIVLNRAFMKNVDKLILTGTDVELSEICLKIAKNYNNLYTTVGCHPTRCNEFEKNGDPSTYLNNLLKITIENSEKVVAIGECGLDYDRLQFCEKDVQKKYFKKQLDLSIQTKLPLFLHCRNAADDFIDIIKKEDYSFHGVVHSFDGSLESLNSFLELGFHIGINGCSLKTEENLEVVKLIPENKLLIETDCPWCEIRPSHAGSKYIKTRFPSSKKEKWRDSCLVKSRNEPCNIIQVLEILSAVREENEDELCEIIYENTEKLFFSKR